MGGHGGLNILPQKRWNVYGRENRLRVARDEEKAAASEQAVQERREVAEGEHRHRLLLERARQRYGSLAATAGGAAEALAVEVAPQQPGVPVRDQATAQAAHEAGLGLGLPPQTTAAEEHRPAKRQRHQRDQRRGAQERSAEQRRAPSLAELARQLDPGVPLDAPPTQPLQPAQAPPSCPAPHQPEQQQPQLLSSAALAPALGPAGSLLAEEAQQHRGELSGRPQHINLFAEEQARAANPEQAAEVRQERRRRGDPLTQTSDAKFDQGFAFGHGVTGAAAVPWYARGGSALRSGQGGPEDHGALLDAWRGSGMHAAAATDGTAGGGAQAAHSSVPSLLQGIKVIPRDVGGSGGDDRDERRREGRSRKGGKVKRQEGKSRRAGGGEQGTHAPQSKAATFAALREERLRREAAERQRESDLIKQAAGRQGDAPGGRRYHTGFGFGR